MARYRAAIIGCGGIGLRHAAAYALMADVELVAGADPSDRRKPQYEELGVERFYGSAEEMLAEEELHLVSVCTPPLEHAGPTVAAAEAGVQGIICEKPMAPDLPSCDAMIDACERNGVKLAIGHQRRYGPQYKRGRELLASGAVGEPLLLWGMTPGSDVMTWGVHWLDMFHFMVPGPEVATVMGQVDVEGQRLTGHGEFVEDALLGHLTFDNNMRVVLECGDAAQPPPDQPVHATVRVYGTGGVFEANDIGSTLMSGDACDHEPVASPFESKDVRVRAQMWMDQAAELIRCIEEGGEHQCNGHAGRRTIEIACAIWESARSRRRVTLPLAPGECPLYALWRGETRPWADGGA